MPSAEAASLRHEIRQAAQTAFDLVRRSHVGERFYAFALYSDDSVMAVSPAANTEEGFRQRAQQYGYTDTRQLNHLRWMTAEWAYEFEGAEHFGQVCKTLSSGERYPGEEDEDPEEPCEAFTAFQDQVFEAMILGLGDLDADGFFGTGDVREAVTLFCSVSDSDRAGGLEDASARRLNSPAVYNQFAARNGGQSVTVTLQGSERA